MLCQQQTRPPAVRPGHLCGPYLPTDSRGSSASPSSSPNPGSSSAAQGAGAGKPPPGNKALLTSLSKSEGTNLMALRPEHAALRLRLITPERMATQTALIGQARRRSGQAVGGTTNKRESTKTEEEARFDLMLSVNEFCTAAKQKYGRSNRTHLQTYRLGERWDSLGRPLMEQYSLDIINAAAVDDLPGCTPEKIVLARQRQTDYVGTNVTQTEATSNATGTRLSLKDLMKLITDFRSETKLAADAEWPHTDPANAPFRKNFGLPLKKKFRG